MVEVEFRLGPGALLAATTRAALRSWLALLVIAPLACLPMAAAYLLTPWIWMGSDRDAWWLGVLAANWICYCAEIAAVQIWTIGITPGVLARARRERGMSARAQPPAMAHGLGTAWLCLYRIASNVVLVCVPGVVQAVRLFVAVPVAITERLPARAAALRSAQFVRGSGMRVFWLLLLLRLLRTTMVMVGGVLAVASVRDQRPFAIDAYGWLYWLVPVPFLAFEAVAMAVAFVQLRAGKETLDVEATAQVFE